MKFVIAFALLIAAATARPQEDVQILKFENNIEGENYNFAYEQSDAQKRAESGNFQPGSEPETGIMNVAGDYSYQLPDGKTVTVTYVADEKGYRPKVSIS